MKFEPMQYAKAIVAVLSAVVAVALTLWVDGDAQKWLTVVNAALGAIGVYLIPNVSSERRPDLSVQD